MLTNWMSKLANLQIPKQTYKKEITRQTIDKNVNIFLGGQS